MVKKSKTKKIPKVIQLKTESGIIYGSAPNPEFLKQQEKKELEKSRKLGTAFGKSIRQFAQAGLREPPSLSFEQDVMQQVMGGGRRGSIWGANNPVTINHDLNAGMRGDSGTAEMFGIA